MLCWGFRRGARPGFGSAGRGENHIAEIGISFAISADLAKHVAEQLMKDGQVLRPWLGAVFEPLEHEEKARLKLEPAPRNWFRRTSGNSRKDVFAASE